MPGSASHTSILAVVCWGPSYTPLPGYGMKQVMVRLGIWLHDTSLVGLPAHASQDSNTILRMNLDGSASTVVLGG
jgi:hypothetical protein